MKNRRSLYPDTMRRISLDEVDLRIAEAMGDPLLDDLQKQVLQIISRHRGACNAIKAVQILRQLAIEQDEDQRRWIRLTVSDLVTRLRVKIGASRNNPAGYFIVVTPNDLDVALQPERHQIESSIRRMRALTCKKDVAMMFGQTMLKLDGETVAEAAARTGADEKRGVA